MKGRDSGGPIRRRAGERKRNRAEEAAKPATPEPAKQPAPDNPPAEASDPTSGLIPATSGKSAPTVVRRSGGRRVFDPGGGRRAPSNRPAGKGRGKPAAAAPGAKRAPAAAAKVVDTGEQTKAKELAADKGIPVVHALRVVRGEATLNDVLKALMRKERAQRLIEHDGLDPGLAGQVASGHLTRERALLVQRIRKHRVHRIDRDALKLAEMDKQPVSLLPFAGEWVEGRVTEARTYEVDVVGEEGAKPVTLQKHDIKLVAAPTEAVAVQAALREDEEIKAKNLAGTADRQERVRPTDEQLIDLVEAGTPIRCMLRDGTYLEGPIKSFGRWDMEVRVGDDVVATVMFHAIHPSTVWA